MWHPNKSRPRKREIVPALSEARKFVLASMISLLSAPALAQSPDLAQRLDVASQVVCRGGINAAPETGAKLIGEVRFRREGRVNWLRDWRVDGSAMIRVTRSDRAGFPSLFFVAFYGGESGRTPLLRLVRDDRCRLRGGERIVYRGDGDEAIRLELLDSSLRERASAIPINPPVPAGQSRPDCTRIGLLDNGVNYLLPALSDRLARDVSGALVGRDFWERDDRPFDFGLPEDERDARLSAFAPPQHGTGIASMIIADAPADICLAAYRYSPNDDRDEIQAMVDRIAADGVRVLIVASGRNRPWPGFRQAMEAHPEILFVCAAGNDGADLRSRQIYPMAYNLANQLVVAAVRRDGNTWPSSNYGQGIVELAIPAVEVPGLSFDGKPALLTGTSYAAPRAAVLAAVIARAYPHAKGSALRTMVLDAARGKGHVKQGMVQLDENALLNLMGELVHP